MLTIEDHKFNHIFRASVEEAERGAKAVLAAAAKDDSEAAQDDEPADMDEVETTEGDAAAAKYDAKTYQDDEGEITEDEETEEAPKSAAEIQKAEELDQDASAEDTLEDKVVT